jgi:ubiquinone/menaquinone biosynthesis C-methylase UbiE
VTGVEVTDEAHRLWARVFDRAAGCYDAVGVDWFGPIAAALVEDLDVQTGERVLDLGCGRGAVLFPAAARVGPMGHVLGIDLAEGMVRATAADARRRGLIQVHVRQADAQAPGLPPGSFDVVAASLVLFFLARPGDAVAHYATLLRPGGRLGFSSFAQDDERWTSALQALAPYLPPIARRRKCEAGPFATTSRLEWMLRRAGYVEVRSVERPAIAVFADPDHWWDWSWSHGHRRYLELIEPEDLPAARESAIAQARALVEPDGTLRIRQVVRYTVARVPD